MRAVVQRVNEASVSVSGQTVGSVGNGLLVYLGVMQDDTLLDVQYLADKLLHLRIFDDDTGTPNLCLLDVSGELLLVSQFTLCADARKGRRPSYAAAARPELAKTLYEAMAELLAKAVTVQTGVFRADMQVFSVNDGPLIILLDSRRQF